MPLIPATAVGASTDVISAIPVYNKEAIHITIENTGGANPLTGYQFRGRRDGSLTLETLDFCRRSPEVYASLATLPIGTPITFTVDLRHINLFTLNLSSAAGTTIVGQYDLYDDYEQVLRQASDGSLVVSISGAASTPLPVYLTNEIDVKKWSNAAGDFTATPTAGTYDIVLNTGILGGQTLSEIHFQTAELEHYVALTEESHVVLLDDFTWTPGTLTLDITNCTNAQEFAAGDLVTLAILSQDKAYNATNNSNVVEGLETDDTAPVGGAIQVVGIEAAADPGAGTAGRVYAPRTYHKQLVPASFNWITKRLDVDNHTLESSAFNAYVTMINASAVSVTSSYTPVRTSFYGTARAKVKAVFTTAGSITVTFYGRYAGETTAGSPLAVITLTVLGASTVEQMTSPDAFDCVDEFNADLVVTAGTVAVTVLSGARGNK